MVGLLVLLLLGGCHGDVFLFFTNDVYWPAPGLDPDALCTNDGRASSHPNLGTGVSTYRALAMTARTQDLTLMLPPSVPVYDVFTPPRLIANDTSFLFAALTPFAWANVVLANGTIYPVGTYFSGSANANGTLAGNNCGDYTGSGFGMIGNLKYNISWQSDYCRPQRFVCLANVLPLPPPPAYNATSVFLFATNTSYTPSLLTLTPDEICRNEGAASPNMRLGPSKVYQALAFTARRQSLLSMFPPGYAIRDLEDNLIAENASSFFKQPMTRIALRDAWNVRKFDVGSAFWTGAADNTGQVAGGNCGDFTGGTADNSKAGRLEEGLESTRRSDDCHPPIDALLPFLCAANVLPLPPPPTYNATSVFLFATNATHAVAPNMDPDQICRNEGAASPNMRLGPSKVYQALAFTARRQSLLPMFPPGYAIRDLDDNLIAENASSFFKNPLTRMALRDAWNITKFDITADFWYGAPYGDDTGRVAGSNCGDFTGGTIVHGGIRSLVSVGSYYPPDYCLQSYRFLCAANVLPPPPPPVYNATSVFLFPTNTSYTAAPNLDPDDICRNEGVASPNMRLGPSKVYQAFVYMKRRPLPEFPEGYAIRDLDDNLIAENVSGLLTSYLPISRMALRDAWNITKMDIDTIFWSGANWTNPIVVGETCSDFTNRNGSAAYGSLSRGFVNYPEVSSCNISYRFLCVANVLPPPTPQPSQAPTMSKAPTAPTMSQAPTAPTTTTAPTMSQAPTAPTMSQAPSAPTMSQAPSAPTMSQAPTAPTVSQAPTAPTVSQAPTSPTASQAPTVPTTPSPDAVSSACTLAPLVAVLVALLWGP